MLSKSASGKTSISIVQKASRKEIEVLLQIKKVEQKTAKKHARLPATVFPRAPGTGTFPISFPIKLAKPSPNASAKIPNAAFSRGKKRAAQKIPHTRVTGPRTNLFSSRFRAAVSVTLEIKGTWIPFNRNNSLNEYNKTPVIKRIRVGIL